jgi:hypothetical protein
MEPVVPRAVARILAARSEGRSEMVSTEPSQALHATPLACTSAPAEHATENDSIAENAG